MLDRRYIVLFSTKPIAQRILEYCAVENANTRFGNSHDAMASRQTKSKVNMAFALMLSATWATTRRALTEETKRFQAVFFI